MNNTKVEYHLKFSMRRKCKQALREWRNQKDLFFSRWKRVDCLLDLTFKREVFCLMTEKSLKERSLRQTFRNLKKIYGKKNNYNTKFVFRAWRLFCYEKSAKSVEEVHGTTTGSMSALVQRHGRISDEYEQNVNKRIHDRMVRKIFGSMRMYK